MPHRLIRENWLDSESVAALSPEAERFLLRLTLCADDAGRFDGRLAILRARLFPLASVTEQALRGWLDECVGQGLLIPYAWEGKPFLQIADWQKAGQSLNSRFPWRDGSFAITYLKRETRDGIKDFVATSLRHPVPIPSASHPAGDPIATPSLSHADGTLPSPYVYVDVDGCVDECECGGASSDADGTRAPGSGKASQPDSKKTPDAPDPPGLPEVLEFARGGAGIDPVVAETWWNEVEGRGWRDGRGQPIDPRRWRNALTAYAMKWKANETRRGAEPRNTAPDAHPGDSWEQLAEELKRDREARQAQS